MNSYNIIIDNVWQNKSGELIKEIINFWKVHLAIPPNVDIEKRAKQVVLIARNEKNEIVGVTTSYLTKYVPLKNKFFIFRGMIDPEYRIPGLFIKMTITTIQILEEFSKTLSEKERAIGIITEMENPNLKKARMTRTSSGMVLVGFSKKENPVYAYYFKGARY